MSALSVQQIRDDERRKVEIEFKHWKREEEAGWEARMRQVVAKVEASAEKDRRKRRQASERMADQLATCEAVMQRLEESDAALDAMTRRAQALEKERKRLQDLWETDCLRWQTDINGIREESDRWQTRCRDLELHASNCDSDRQLTLETMERNLQMATDELTTYREKCEVVESELRRTIELLVQTQLREADLEEVVCASRSSLHATVGECQVCHRPPSSATSESADTGIPVAVRALQVLREHQRGVDSDRKNLAKFALSRLFTTE